MENKLVQPPVKRPGFAWRALTSVLIAASSLMLVFSGIILFVSPPGRVANWTDWRMVGLTKHDWTGLHVWFALVFLVVALLHAVFNIRPLVNYFKNRQTRRVGFRWEWVVGVGMAIAVFAGTRAALPPFSTLLAFNERVKKGWEDPASRAPVPHAELLTLRELCDQAKVPYETAVERLEARGYKAIRPEIIAGHLAATNGITPRHLFEVIQPRVGARQTGKAGEPGGGGKGGGGYGGGHGAGGAGWKTLSEFCADEKIDLQEAIRRLEAKGLKVSADKTLRAIAVDNGYDRPYELVELLRAK